jgi:hypothetical protein
VQRYRELVVVNGTWFPVRGLTRRTTYNPPIPSGKCSLISTWSKGPERKYCARHANPAIAESSILTWKERDFNTLLRNSWAGAF